MWNKLSQRILLGCRKLIIVSIFQNNLCIKQKFHLNQEFLHLTLTVCKLSSPRRASAGWSFWDRASSSKFWSTIKNFHNDTQFGHSTFFFFHRYNLLFLILSNYRKSWQEKESSVKHLLFNRIINLSLSNSISPKNWYFYTGEWLRLRLPKRLYKISRSRIHL